jgi:hypothetical protein
VSENNLPGGNSNQTVIEPVLVITLASADSDAVFSGPSQNSYSLAAAKAPTKPQPVRKNVAGGAAKRSKVAGFSGCG